MKQYIARFSVLTALSGSLALIFGMTAAATSSAAAIRPIVTNGVVRPVAPSYIRPNACGKTVTYGINNSGGAFVLPRCKGLSGKITYGPNNAPPSAGVTLTAYPGPTNPLPSQCGTASGETTLAYLTVTSTGNGSVTYKKAARKSRIKDTKLNRQATYTLYAYSFGSPQFSVSLGHPNSRGVLKFPSPLNKKTIPLGVPLCFELDTP